MHLLQVKRLSPDQLMFQWSDGHAGPVSLRSLRDRCPCAACQGESVLLHSYVPLSPDTSVPGRYDLKAVETIGNYALKFRWADGHDQGLYTWEHLRSLCECPECLGKGGRADG